VRVQQCHSYTSTVAAFTPEQHLFRNCHTQQALSQTTLSCKPLLQAAPADVHRHVLDCVITATHLLQLWTNRRSVLQGSSAAPRLLTAIVLSYVGFPWEGPSEAKVRRHALTPGGQRGCSRSVHAASSHAGLIVASHHLSVGVAVCVLEHLPVLYMAAGQLLSMNQ
jgi:hypothetical protein